MTDEAEEIARIAGSVASAIARGEDPEGMIAGPMALLALAGAHLGLEIEP